MILRLTPEQFAAAQARALKWPTETGRAFPASGVQAPKKYKNRATGGYQSVKEARRAAELKLMEKAGAISGLSEQVKFLLIPAQRDDAGKLLEHECSYYADFQYRERGELVVEDVKSEPTQTTEFKIKKKLMLMVHGIRLRIT